MPAIEQIVKDPDSIEWFTVPWFRRLARTVTIEGSTWILPAGLTQVAVDITGLLTSVKLSGGVLGQTYSVTNRITTAAMDSQTLDYTFQIVMQEG